MIEVFLPGNEEYSSNGDVVLTPVICDVEAGINTAWTLELEHGIDDQNKWKYIQEDGKIRVDSFNGSQLFTIKKITKTDTGISIKALPVFMDCTNDCFIFDKRPTNKTGQEALNDILESNSKYSGSSNITKRASAYYVLKNAMEAITGSENSFLERWGGEILFDNYKIIINDRIGGDYGVTISYGKNIQENGISEVVDISEVVTRIIPKAYNGYILPNNRSVDSPLIDRYPSVKTKVIEFTNIRLASDVEGEEDTSGLIVCETLDDLYQALIIASEKEFNENNIDKPKVTITCNIYLLENTEEYSEYSHLEEVRLGDTVYCEYSKLGITSSARVNSLVWDCISKRVKSVTIGTEEVKFMDRIVSSVKSTEAALTKDGNVLGGQIIGLIDGAMAQLRLQNTIAKKQDVRAILFEDLDPNSPTFGAMALGTKGWQISNKRTPDNRDWIWTTAATGDGIIADTIVAGLLTDRYGNNYWNLNTGAFSLTGATITDSDIDGYATDGELEYVDGRVSTLNNELNSFESVINDAIDNLQDQIDGQITTWYYAYEPTLSNKPASDWTTIEEKNNHIGDLFYNSETGYAYRFMLDGSTYKWVRIADDDISEALRVAQEAQDTADGKRRVFTAQPTNSQAYDIGDLWVNATYGTTYSNDVLRCKTAKAEGAAFNISHWQKASRYTDDTALNTFIAGQFATLSAQVDEKAETYYQSTDPSTSWSASEKPNHEGDLWYDTSLDSFNQPKNETKRWNGTEWVLQNVPTEVFDKIDGKAQIFISQPKPPYAEGDLWFNSATSDIMTCIKARSSGTYMASEWQKRNKYTDDTTANAYTDDKISNLEIGGVNLLPDSNAPSYTKVAGTQPRYISDSGQSSYISGEFFEVTDPPVAGIKYGYRLSCTTANPSSTKVRGYAWAAAESLIQPKDGETYTLSCYVRKVSGTPFILARYGYRKTGTTTTTYPESAVKELTSEQWEKFSYTFVYGAGNETVDNINPFYPINLRIQALGVVEACGFKLEKGDKATEWAPSPIDTGQSIDSLESKVIKKYVTCSTGAGTAAKVGVCAGFTLYTGATIVVNFTNQNTVANPTLNVNGTGAKTIQAKGANIPASSPFSWKAGALIEFIYDGTYWQMVNTNAQDFIGYYDEYLDQTAVFNKLTQNGTKQGIFMTTDGELYVNMTYLQGGIAKLGGANNKDGVIELYNASGKKIIRGDNTGLYIGDIDSSILNARIKLLADSGEINGVDIKSERTESGTTYNSIMHNEVFTTTEDDGSNKWQSEVSPRGLVSKIFSSQSTSPFRTITVNATGSAAMEMIRVTEGSLGPYDYLDWVLLTQGNIMAELSNDPRWTDPTRQYLFNILKELLVSSRFLIGDTETFDIGPYAGHVTNALKDLNVFFPHYKNADGLNVTVANVTLPNYLIVRIAGGGYLNNSGSTGIPKANLTVKSVTHRAGGFNVVFGMKDGSAFTGATNNSPVSVMVSGNMTVKFTKA